ncbi:hypothetical protein ACTMTI_09125 [Nonomuraea sp. H19]|uniref:hypothetical protein n=1 Tax=Nonomuraea sp. H19 TaxID=3452206 RepID=UPI003F8A6B07
MSELGAPLVIDEVQRVGEPLVLAIKEVVDSDSSPGQFLLTGSSNFLTVPSIARDAGRPCRPSHAVAALGEGAHRWQLDRVTASNCQPWLETTFLMHRLPAWSRNLSAKVVKRPKL